MRGFVNIIFGSFLFGMGQCVSYGQETGCKKFPVRRGTTVSLADRKLFRQEISRIRFAPLEMTERQTAYHHFKPHGYRNASKKRLRRNDCHFSQSLFICFYFILASTEGVGARFSETSGSSLKPPDFLSCFSLFFSMKW